MSTQAIEAALLVENANRCNPPLDDDEVRRIAQSVGRYEPVAAEHGLVDPISRVARDAGEAELPPAIVPIVDPEIGAVPTAWLDEPPPPRRYLLDGVLPRSKVGLYVAPGGTGKGWTLLQIAVSTATGLPAFGRWDVSEPGAVLLLAGEDEPDELRRRLWAVYQALRGDSDSDDIRKPLLRRLYLHSVVGQDPALTFVVPDTRGVSRTSYVGRLIATARAIPGLALIILDPVSRFNGGEENDARHATAFVETLEYIAQETGATVLAAHHANKASQGHDGSMDQGAARGSSALTDGVRWQANLATMTSRQAKDFQIAPDDRRRYVRLEIPKNNYAPPIEGFWLARQPGGYLVAVDLEPVPTGKRTAPNETHLPAVVALVRDEISAGREYTRRQFADNFGGMSGRLKVSMHQLRSVIQDALIAGDLVERDPRTAVRKGLKVLAPQPAFKEVIR